MITEKVGEREFEKKEEVGNYYTVADILNILDKERIFMTQSDGGVTFSGGEPMMQHEFLLEALKACKENGYHTTVDTSGYSSPENFKEIIPFTDLFLFDLKHLDDAKHYEYTGVSNAVIIDNLKMIIESRSRVMIRIPVVPGFNDDNDHLERLKLFINEHKTRNLKKINLLPFHKIGSSKYGRFNLPYRMDYVPQPSSERMRELKEFFSGTGVKVKTGG